MTPPNGNCSRFVIETNQNQSFSSRHSVGIEVLFQGTFRVAVSFLSCGFSNQQNHLTRGCTFCCVCHTFPQLLFSRLHRLSCFAIFVELRSVIETDHRAFCWKAPMIFQHP